jgi:hypothetical protein
MTPVGRGDKESMSDSQDGMPRQGRQESNGVGQGCNGVG